MSDGGDCCNDDSLLPASLKNLMKAHGKNIKTFCTVGFSPGASDTIL